MSAGERRRNFLPSRVRSRTATSRLSSESFWLPICSSAVIQSVRAAWSSGGCVNPFSFNRAWMASDLPPMTAKVRSR